MKRYDVSNILMNVHFVTLSFLCNKIYVSEVHGSVKSNQITDEFRRAPYISGN